MTIKEMYCSFCQKPVKPIRTIVNYRCPHCGATFMASHVESEEPSSGEGARKEEATARA